MRLGAQVFVAALSFWFSAICPLVANAQDKPLTLAAQKPQAETHPSQDYKWAGPYVGVSVGATWGSFEPTTSTVVSPTYLFKKVDVAAVNAAGRQDGNPSGFLGGIQAGYNFQFGQTVVGLETDLDYLHLNSAVNSGGTKYPGGGSGFATGVFRYNQFVISSYTNADWIWTLRPRIGITADSWLFYATGGLALTRLQGQFLFTDANAVGPALGAYQEADVSSVKAGYIVGGGIETALTDRLRMKAEYSYLNFGTTQAHETVNNFQCCFPAGTSQTFTQSMKLNANLFRVGLNYDLADSKPTSGVSQSWLDKLLAQKSVGRSDWEFDVGTRAWFSTGTVGAPDPLLDLSPSQINSRLTYENAHAWSGETFARADHVSGFFAKGFIGAGGVNSGKLIDEDFPANHAYSSTASRLSGSLSYWNADVGYTFLKSPNAKVGAFLGYNVFNQHYNGFGCIQQAGDSLCAGSDSDPTFLALAEDERYSSIRVGLTAQFKLNDRLTFSAEAAYLPKVKLRAQDDHNFRQLLLPESSDNGDGMMLESILSYAVNQNWSVGIGARYWTWNMHDGIEYFDFLGLPPPTIPQAGRFSSERYGMFIQSDYRWGAVAPSSRETAASAPMNWSGIYVGGHLGGAVSNDRWSDPFGTTMRGGLPNQAGFGDTIRGTGPLGGAQAGLNYQVGNWVFGFEGSWSAADVLGENTCFSGLGGLNCQQVIKSIATGSGRLGYAWDRALVYAKGGGAQAKINYALLGNTNGPTRGDGTADVTGWGWVAGGGLEYALTDHWTTVCDYEFVNLGNISAPFPSVALVRNQRIHVKQSIDEFKLGVNYKFDPPISPVALN